MHSPNHPTPATDDAIWDRGPCPRQVMQLLMIPFYALQWRLYLCCYSYEYKATLKQTLVRPFATIVGRTQLLQEKATASETINSITMSFNVIPSTALRLTSLDTQPLLQYRLAWIMLDTVCHDTPNAETVTARNQKAKASSVLGN